MEVWRVEVKGSEGHSCWVAGPESEDSLMAEPVILPTVGAAEKEKQVCDRSSAISTTSTTIITSTGSTLSQVVICFLFPWTCSQICKQDKCGFYPILQMRLSKA